MDGGCGTRGVKSVIISAWLSFLSLESVPSGHRKTRALPAVGAPSSSVVRPDLLDEEVDDLDVDDFDLDELFVLRSPMPAAASIS